MVAYISAMEQLYCGNDRRPWNFHYRDAIMKEIPGFDYEEAYELMRKNAFTVNTDHQSYVDGKGRRAMESYLRYGYIPLEDGVPDAFHKREQVSRTLEYAYDDYVLSQVARKLGKTEDYEVLIKRAANYKNVIDPETGYVRGRMPMDDGWNSSIPISRSHLYAKELLFIIHGTCHKTLTDYAES